MRHIAIVRGPNLNSWEMQNFAPLSNDYEFTAICSHGNNFDLHEVPFPIVPLWSWGQLLPLRFFRRVLEKTRGDYHDLIHLGEVLDGFDIVHTVETSYYCSYQAAQAKRKRGFRLVVTVWENLPFNRNHPAARRLKDVVFRQTDLFLAVTRRARDVLILEGVPPEKIAIQMLGIDTDHFRPREKDRSLLEQFGCTGDDVVLLFVAHLSVQKGIYDLLYAMHLLRTAVQARFPVKLLVAGAGPEHGRLTRLIAQLQLSECVRLIGSHPYSVMPQIHNLADVFILPSQPSPVWQEQFGYVLVESMACGKPVISTETGSIPEVVGDAGVLVPPADFVALAGAIESFLVSQVRRKEMGLAARRRAETLFDVRSVALQLKAHYESLYQKDMV